MSVQTALQFIQRVRSDETLRRAIAGNGEEKTLDRVVQIAAGEGFVFTVDHLQEAHKYDWGMRWAHYRPRENSEGNGHSGDRVNDLASN